MGTRLAPNELPGWPRGMRVELAAAYIGSSVSQLLVMEDAGEIVSTRLSTGRKVYLREHLDRLLDRKDGRGDAGLVPAADVPDWQKALLADGKGDAAVR